MKLNLRNINEQNQNEKEVYNIDYNDKIDKLNSKNSNKKYITKFNTFKILSKFNSANTKFNTFIGNTNKNENTNNIMTTIKQRYTNTTSSNLTKAVLDLNSISNKRNKIDMMRTFTVTSNITTGHNTKALNSYCTQLTSANNSPKLKIKDSFIFTQPNVGESQVTSPNTKKLKRNYTPNDNNISNL